MDTLSDNLAVTLTISQMHDLIENCMREVLQEIEKLKEDSAKYLTRKEACERLHVSMPTLARYIDRGLVRGQKLGNRVLILEEDITNALRDISTRKYNK